MIPGEFAAIEARANAAADSRAAIEVCLMNHLEPPFEFNGRISASQEDIPRLLAAVRERDNTIARVRALHVKGPSDGGCSNTDCECHGYPTCLHCNEYNAKGVIWPCATIAALDPQETP